MKKLKKKVSQRLSDCAYYGCVEKTQNATLGVLGQVLSALAGSAGWPDRRAALQDNSEPAPSEVWGVGLGRHLLPVG